MSNRGVLARQRRRRMEVLAHMGIYILRPVMYWPGLIKIGRSHDPRKRAHSMYPAPLWAHPDAGDRGAYEVMFWSGWIDRPSRIEAEIHCRLHEWNEEPPITGGYRFPGIGEFYRMPVEEAQVVIEEVIAEYHA